VSAEASAENLCCSHKRAASQFCGGGIATTLAIARAD